MPKANNPHRVNELLERTLFDQLSQNTQAFILHQVQRHKFSQQDLKLLCEIAADLSMWGSDGLEQIWPDESKYRQSGKALKKCVIQNIRDCWKVLQSEPNQYPEKGDIQTISAAAIPVVKEKPKLGLGYCPVASPKTRCCNLQTLDAVDNCGYGCSYCSIQSFFDGKQISFDKGFADKLNALQLDPDKTYHIGTGQSSDSLMWGNSHGVLDAVLQFAHDHPNVILEFKTKSANIKHLLTSNLPKNILCTWSLNSETIIQREEHGTASLSKRIEAARAVADRGVTVGFHFHPMVHYQGWNEEYKRVINQVSKTFQPSEVALVSLGTLTFIKPVIREIRKRGIESQILKFPMADAQGKYSYPNEIKVEMFSHAYQCFPPSWQKQVFFYLCMEADTLWQPIFGFSYKSNDDFEKAMKKAYLSKINQCLVNNRM
jgi:spore photoproduct lyase